MAGHHFLGIGQGYFIFELDIRQTRRFRLHGQGCSLIADPHAHLATVFECDQAVPDLLLTGDLAAPSVVTNQELSFDLDGHTLPRCRRIQPAMIPQCWLCNRTATWPHTAPHATPCFLLPHAMNTVSNSASIL